MAGLSTAPAVPSAARRPDAARPNPDRGVVAVRIGAQEFALDIMAVREIRGWTAPTPLPWAPAYVPGMIDLRGVIIPVIDLGARLGLPAAAPTALSVVVVVQVRDRLTGLLVDGVSDLMTLEAGRLQPTPATGGPAPEEIVQGVFEADGRILAVIALEAVVPADLAELTAAAA